MSYLEHSAKGKTWTNHKYLRKEGNRYIYKENTQTSLSDRIKQYQKNKQLEREGTAKKEKEFNENIRKQVDDYISSTRFMQIMETPFKDLPNLVQKFAAEDKQKKEIRMGNKK